jgi:hypothetical protein
MIVKGEEQQKFTRPQAHDRSKALAAYDDHIDVMIKITSFFSKCTIGVIELCGRY